MKKFNLFEAGIIGFFVGVIVASYWAFLENIGGVFGNILRYISLTPLLDSMNFSANGLVYISFIFFVIVYTIYGVILGLIFRVGKKIKVTFIILILLVIVGVYFEQRGLAKLPHKTANVSGGVDVGGNSVGDANMLAKKIEQYFGEIEARGDINADGKDDIAFIISRKDPDRGILYYLSAALDIKKGYQGTNLLFLGDKIEPKQISIEEEKVIVDYINHGIKTATSTTKLYAKLVSDVLTEDKTNVSTSSKSIATSTKSIKSAR